MRTLREFRDREDGASYVEFLMVLPVLLLLIVGAFQFGHAFAYFHSAEKSMRAAARYLARVPAAGLDTWGLARARNIAIFGTVDGSGSPLLFDWTDTTSVQRMAAGPDVIRLTAEVPLSMPVFAAFGLGTFTFQVSHEQRYIGH